MKIAFCLSSLLTVVAASFILFTSSAHAATFNVVAGTDAIEENSQCQLSEAIQNINDQAVTNADCAAGDGNNDTINLPSGTITLSGDLPEIAEPVAIQGISELSSIIDGVTYRAQFWNENFIVASISVSDLTINNGLSSGVGASGLGIFTEMTAESVSLNNAADYMQIIADNSNAQTSIQNISINAPSTDPTCAIYIRAEDRGISALIEDVSIDGCGDANIYTDATNNFPGQITLRDIGMSNSGECRISDSRESSTIAAYAYLLERVSITRCTGGVSIANRIDFSAENLSYTLRDINITDNNVIDGGNLYMSINAFTTGSTVDVQRVTIANNSSVEGTSRGELVFNVFGRPDSVVRNITFSNNILETNSDMYPSSTGVFLAQLGDSEPMIAENITLSNNHSTNGGSGGSYNGLGMLTVDDLLNPVENIGEVNNALLSNNTINNISSNCTGTDYFFESGVSVLPRSSGGNISDDASCNDYFTHPTDQTEVSGLASTLGPLTDNGGLVPTIPLLPGSPAIDAGVTVPGLTTDARGVSRPQCAAYDSGAYEYNGTCPVPQQLTYADSEKGTTVSLILPSDVTAPTVSAVDPDTIPQDGENKFPAGLTSFQFTTTPGATKAVTLYYDLPGNPSDYTARKYKTNTQTFIDVPNASITREDYNGKSMLKLTYAITDGGILDQDGLANGTVIDPVGLATTSLASTGENLYVYFASIMTLLSAGVWALRKVLQA